MDASYDPLEGVPPRYRASRLFASLHNNVPFGTSYTVCRHPSAEIENDKKQGGGVRENVPSSLEECSTYKSDYVQHKLPAARLKLLDPHPLKHVPFEGTTTYRSHFTSSQHHERSIFDMGNARDSREKDKSAIFTPK